MSGLERPSATRAAIARSVAVECLPAGGGAAVRGPGSAADSVRSQPGLHSAQVKHRTQTLVDAHRAVERGAGGGMSPRMASRTAASCDAKATSGDRPSRS